MPQSRPAGGKVPPVRIGLALAGGGPLGVIYEIGALLALDQALDGIDFNNLHVYVGVSAGAAVSSALANGLSPAKICRVFVLNDSKAFPLNPQHFLRPSLRLYGQTLSNLPGVLYDALRQFLGNRRDISLVGALSRLGQAVPPGFWDNIRIHEFLAKLYSSRGRTNDFRKLKRRLYVVAMNLDTGEIVRFGAPGSDQVPISKAVQASTAVPGLFPPVEMDGRYYVDGGLKKTVHASTALEAGAELLFCVNPIVSFNPKQAPPGHKKTFNTLVEGGLPVVLSQAFRTLLHSRMQIGMARYPQEYPDRDLIVFEPDAGDADIFFAPVFSFGQRLKVCEHAYQTTRADLRARQRELAPVLARHGIRLRLDVLEDRTRHFDSHLDIPPEVHRQTWLQHPVTNELSDLLDQVQAWVQAQEEDPALAASLEAEQVP
jgi:predicted acylesterase/phospholipase RssA